MVTLVLYDEVCLLTAFQIYKKYCGCGLTGHNTPWNWQLVVSRLLCLWKQLQQKDLTLRFCSFFKDYLYLLVVDTWLYTLPCWSVRPSVDCVSELWAVFALLVLPNHPRLDCRVSGLVTYEIQKHLKEHKTTLQIIAKWKLFVQIKLFLDYLDCQWISLLLLYIDKLFSSYIKQNKNIKLLWQNPLFKYSFQKFLHDETIQKWHFLSVHKLHHFRAG